MRKEWYLLSCLLLGAVTAWCPENCGLCNADQSCGSCVSGYYLNILVCSKCSIDNCDECPNNVCTKCLKDFNLSEGDCFDQGSGLLYLVIGICFLIVICVGGTFVLMWKWQSIRNFFNDHHKELKRLEEGKKKGASWITAVMKANKIMPSSGNDDSNLGILGVIEDAGKRDTSVNIDGQRGMI